MDQSAEKILQHRRGFTLVEMSIVLVIVGLIVGGVLVGRDLIQQSRLRKVVSQVSSYNSATNAFRTKYNGIPGDIERATSYGLADPACPPGLGPTPPVVPGCNGSGDNLLTSDTENAENINFWRHLYVAGMIDGNYDGMTVAFGSGAPTTPLRDTTGFYAGTSTVFSGYNIFIIGLDATAPGQYRITPYEAWALDNRTDDGMPVSGVVQMPPDVGFVDVCRTADPGSEYLSDDEDNTYCVLYMRASF